MESFKILAAIILITASSIVSAQDRFSDAFTKALVSNKSVPVTATLFINEHPSKKEQFTSNWEKGSIVFTNGTTATNCNLRYNCWKDELIWLRNSDFKTGTVIKTTVQEFSINKQRFIKYDDNQSLIKTSLYLEALAIGKVSLYCHRKVTFLKSSDTFSDNHQYYLKVNGKMIKINLRKSRVMPQFSESQQKAIKLILRENHLKLKDEYELAKALDIYNVQIKSKLNL
ncbi:MAG: hypothetical protein PF517_02245 [Salinivirgaceae bacterium]|jgi:hypothetical protein|nr:hypothetical protein [Salinivirgaceae bacterium]